jgi:hypothetical protein
LFKNFTFHENRYFQGSGSEIPPEATTADRVNLMEVIEAIISLHFSCNVFAIPFQAIRKGTKLKKIEETSKNDRSAPRDTPALKVGCDGFELVLVA